MEMHGVRNGDLQEIMLFFAVYSESVQPGGGRSQPSLTGRGGETMRATTAKNKGLELPFHVCRNADCLNLKTICIMENEEIDKTDEGATQIRSDLLPPNSLKNVIAQTYSQKDSRTKLSRLRAVSLLSSGRNPLHAFSVCPGKWKFH